MTQASAGSLRIGVPLAAVPGRTGPLPPAVAALKQRIHQAHPDLDRPDLADWDRVCILRHWAWSHIPTADLPLTFPANSSGWLPMNAAEIFTIFDLDCGGVWCSGAAQALRALYHAYGFATALVNLYLPPQWGGTHAATLVRLRHRERWIWSVQDAYFNLTYTDAQAQALDFGDMIQLLSRLRDREVLAQAMHLPVQRPPVSFISESRHQNRPPGQIAQEWWCVQPDNFQHSLLPDGRLKLISPRVYDRYAPYLAGFRSFLAAHGLPACDTYKYLFLNPQLQAPEACARLASQLHALSKTAGTSQCELP